MTEITDRPTYLDTAAPLEARAGDLVSRLTLEEKVGLMAGSAAFTLRLTLDKNANPGAQILRVLIKYQSCNDRLCLPPRTDAVNVPVAVE